MPSSRTPASRNVRNKCLLFPSAPICAALLQPLELAKTFIQKVKVLMVQSCPTLCDLMDCSPPGSSVHRTLQTRIWSGLPFPSPGDLPTQGSNSGLQLCRQILLHLSHQGSPNRKVALRILEWTAIPFSRGSFLTQRSKLGVLHCRWILYHLSHKARALTSRGGCYYPLVGHGNEGPRKQSTWTTLKSRASWRKAEHVSLYPKATQFPAHRHLLHRGLLPYYL